MSDDVLATFQDVQCHTPDCGCSVSVFSSYINIQGNELEYKIPITAIVGLYLLPHHNKTKGFIVLSLDPPVKQGEKVYIDTVLLFSNQDEETKIQLLQTDEELKTVCGGRLESVYTGRSSVVLANLIKSIHGSRAIKTPNKRFKQGIAHNNDRALRCSYNSSSGYLYPLDKNFIFIHHPVLHIRNYQVYKANFKRQQGTTGAFDLEIKMEDERCFVFSGIEDTEYRELQRYLSKDTKIKRVMEDDDGEDNDDEDSSKKNCASNAASTGKKKKKKKAKDERGFIGPATTMAKADFNESEDDEEFDPATAAESDEPELEFDSDVDVSDSDVSGPDSDFSDSDHTDTSQKQTNGQPPIILNSKKRSAQLEEGKPKTGYFVWYQEHKATITGKRGEAWDLVSEEVKEKYEKKAAELNLSAGLPVFHLALQSAEAEAKKSKTSDEADEASDDLPVS